MSTNARVVIRTFESSRGGHEFGERSDLLASLRKLCETTLDHPGLARPLAFGSEKGIPYLVYSDLPGTAMDAVMRKDGPRPVAEVLQRARQLAEAIDMAASAGVHHGMMAPGDVILDREGTGVMGLGLAQALIKAGIPAEAAAPYGSPQRLAGAPPTRADDIYSLAAVTLELLIGTPKDPDQEARALREAQGLPERRRLPRPAPHETRVFTTIAGADAGKLRASFAAAFSDEPGDRPSTAAEFVASVQDAMSNKRIDEPAASAAVVPIVSGTRSSAAPVLNSERAGEEADLDLVGDELFSAVAPLRAGSMDRPPSRVPVGSRPWALVVAATVAVSFASGFGGGFIVGQQSKPSTGPIEVSRVESVGEPPLARAAVEDSSPIASPAPSGAPNSAEPASSSAATVAAVAPQHAVTAVDAGRLLVRSTPVGAEVAVDGQPRGQTPLALRDLAFGTHTIDVSYPDHVTRRQRVTLSERRPARSVDVELRPTIVSAPATAVTNVTGSLQVVSRPTGAQVFVDDNLIGTTPLLLSEVATGSRNLRIELSGYKIWATSVQIQPGARLRVSASLEP